MVSSSVAVSLKLASTRLLNLKTRSCYNHCRRWGKKTKSKTQPLQVYIVRRAWEKSHDELKIDDDIIEVSNQIRIF